VLAESDLRDLKLREAFFEQPRWWRLLFGQSKKPSPIFLQFAVRRETWFRS
jgi:hypothetical protein